jgi:hypothetical protein
MDTLAAPPPLCSVTLSAVFVPSASKTLHARPGVVCAVANEGEQANEEDPGQGAHRDPPRELFCAPWGLPRNLYTSRHLRNNVKSGAEKSNS